MLSIHDDPASGTVSLNLASHHNLSELQHSESMFIRSLLCVFMPCHHILLFQDAARFKPQWLSVFHFLQDMTLKLIAPLVDVMRPLFASLLHRPSKMPTQSSTPTPAQAQTPLDSIASSEHDTPTDAQPASTSASASVMTFLSYSNLGLSLGGDFSASPC